MLHRHSCRKCHQKAAGCGCIRYTKHAIRIELFETLNILTDRDFNAWPMLGQFFGFEQLRPVALSAERK
jgi:hypothetical protein